MQQRRALDEKKINRELLIGNLQTPPWWMPTVIVLTFFVIIGWILIGLMINKGLGVTGLS